MCVCVLVFVIHVLSCAALLYVVGVSSASASAAAAAAAAAEGVVIVTSRMFNDVSQGSNTSQRNIFVFVPWRHVYNPGASNVRLSFRAVFFVCIKKM